MKIFSNEFVSVVRSYLDSVCADGRTVNQAALCAAINLDNKYKPVLGMLVPLGLLPGYNVRLGPCGGFVLENAATNTIARNGNAGLADEFISNLRDVLNKYVPTNGIARITRERIALAMGMPGSKTENLISAAIKKGLCPGFATKVAGPMGGIHRVAAVVEPAALPEVIEAAIDTEEEDTMRAEYDFKNLMPNPYVKRDEPVVIEDKPKKRSGSRKAKNITISDVMAKNEVV